MWFYLKWAIGMFLNRIGYLAELGGEYYPKRKVYFGRTMRQWRREQERRNILLFKKEDFEAVIKPVIEI